MNQPKRLHIDDNKITDDACDVITAGIKENSSLVELWMWGNNISSEAAECLMKALFVNNTLEDLWLPSYPQDIREMIRSLQQELWNRIYRGFQRELYVLIL